MMTTQSTAPAVPSMWRAMLIIVVLFGGVVALTVLGPMSAFGQKNDNRPPKEEQKVKERDKQQPPSNSNNQSNNSNRKGHG